MQRASARELAARRAAIVAAVRGGRAARVRQRRRHRLDRAHRRRAGRDRGRGRLGPLRARRCSTPTARSRPRPAALFALPVVRRPGRGVATALGGGYLASGAGGRAPAAAPVLPARPAARPPARAPARCRRRCSAPPPTALRIGDRVWFRHAKAGELCERFDALHLVEGDARRGRRCRPTAARAAPSSEPRRAPSGAEHALQYAFSKRPSGSSSRATACEVVPARGSAGAARARSGMALAPVRAPAERVHQRLDLAEGRLARHPLGTRARRRSAVSRPWAGESSASSAATKRSSTGNGTGWRSRISRAPRTASAACSRGIAYSISVKRTSRGLAKMRCDQSTRSRPRGGRAAKRLMRGIARGKRAPGAAERSNAWLSSSTSLAARRGARGAARGGVLGAVVRARERQRRVREVEELEVVVRVRALVERVEHLLQRRAASTPRSLNAGTQRSVTAVTTPSEPSPTRAARRRSPSSSVSVRRSPSPVTSSSASTCAREVRQPRAGAVRAGRERAGERLGVDVAEVRERQPALLRARG